MDHPRTARAPGSNSIRSIGARLVVALGLALVLASASGCMVMDELDTAAAKMPTKAADQQKKKSEQARPASAAERLAAAKRTVDERSRKWWSEARTMTPGESTAGIVSCRLPEGTKFMSTDDCLSQGGTPATRRG